MGKIDVQSYRAHTEVLNFLTLSKFRTGCGSVVGWEKNHTKKFHIKDIETAQNKKLFQCIVTILYCIFPSLFAVCLVVGLREREEFCIPVIWITKVLLDLSDTSHLSLLCWILVLQL